MTMDDDEFGHAVAARLRQLPWFAERWPQDEEEGCALFHDIVDVVDERLRAIMPARSQGCA